VDSQFDSTGQPKTAQILIAKRRENSLVRSTDSARIMQQVNTNQLNYAPATSASELEIFFTRLKASEPAIYRSIRPNIALQFGPPRKIEAITGFAEEPTLSPDERSLYYHKKENGRFVIYRVTKR